jgi:anti-sigma factor (TIGR02949 family)
MLAMQCDEVRRLVGAYVDGELDEEERLRLRDHLAGCRDCEAEAAALARLSHGIRAAAPAYRAPELLRARLRAGLRHEAAANAWALMPAGRSLAYAASLLLAVALGSGGTYVMVGERQQDRLAAELVDSHLRSLLGTHLTDVGSSDQHTVKPWFAGKTALSPPAVDLAQQGFPLIGGRLDLVAGRPVPALVYRHRAHIINLFVLPAGTGDVGDSAGRGGYNLRHWREGDLDLWAVSDTTDLPEFESAFRTATAGG